VLSRDKFVIIPQAYNRRRFDWIGLVVFTLIWGVFHIKSGVLLFMRFWLQLVATKVGSNLPQLVVIAVGVVVISCNQLLLG
jgi:hypothetical protein